jgi:hypothetical protein
MIRRKTFDQLFFSRRELAKSFEIFYSANLPAYSRGASEEHSGEPTFDEFARSRSRFIRLMVNAIRDGSFEFHPARERLLFVDKPRLMYGFQWPERFILYHFARIQYEYTEDDLPDALFSYRSGRGNLLALKRAGGFISRRSLPLFVLRLDIKDYGPSMQHSFIESDFAAATGASPELRKFFTCACTFPFIRDGELLKNTLGLPSGSYLQVLAQNLYLRELDFELMQFTDCLYLRYSDDILFMAPERSLAERAEGMISDFIAKRGLKPNTDKSTRFVLCKPHEHHAVSTRCLSELPAVSQFEYLGSILDFRGKQSLPARKLRLVQGGLRRRLTALAANLSGTVDESTKTQILVEAARTLVNFRDPLSLAEMRDYVRLINDEAQLQAIDRWLVSLIVELISQKGWKRGALRGNLPAKLRSLGLPSLLHIRRTGGL